MPLTNIIDGRKRRYRWRKINAVVEATWHDNSCKDSDQIDETRIGLGVGPDYQEREHIALAEAVSWAQSFETDVTLYLYDEEGGIYPTKRI